MSTESNQSPVYWPRVKESLMMLCTDGKKDGVERAILESTNIIGRHPKN
ncbi:MAG: hypothetical protein CM1200mP35_09980 [Chloroflexota bacterium]|nr:MAG: hypothetical protein CM1200mP35_09980 [Chloroflexota bacterium]